MKIPFFALCIFILSPYSQAQAVYTVGLENINYPPFSYVKNNNIEKSYFRDILEAFGQENNIKFSFKTYPVKRLFQEFAAEKIDFKVPDNPNWYIDKRLSSHYIYSDYITESYEAVFKQKDLNEITSVALILGFNEPRTISGVLPKNIKFHSTPKVESAIKMIREKRVQSIYVSQEALNDLYPENNLVEDQNFERRNVYYHISTIKHPNVITKFNEWFKANKEKVNLIKKRYSIK